MDLTFTSFNTIAPFRTLKMGNGIAPLAPLAPTRFRVTYTGITPHAFERRGNCVYRISVASRMPITVCHFLRRRQLFAILYMKEDNRTNQAMEEWRENSVSPKSAAYCSSYSSVFRNGQCVCVQLELPLTNPVTAGVHNDRHLLAYLKVSCTLRCIPQKTNF